MFNKAISWELFSGENPIKKVKLPKLSNRRERFLSHEEADRLLEELKKVSKTTHDEALLSLHSGLRFNEIASLTWGDIDFTHLIISLTEKGGGRRQVFMTLEVKIMLEGRRPEIIDPKLLVFPSRKGEKQNGASNAFERAAKRLGLNSGNEDAKQKVVFHTLRHTFASWLAIQGTPILTIKELMGHRSIEMTMRYAHLIPDQKRDAIKALAQAFSDKRNHNSVTEPDPG